MLDGKTPVITVVQKDTSVNGKINIEKYGEVLTDFRDGKLIYEEKGLANAKYEIFAREDIYDHQMMEALYIRREQLLIQ